MRKQWLQAPPSACSPGRRLAVDLELHGRPLPQLEAAFCKGHGQVAALAAQLHLADLTADGRQLLGLAVCGA